MKTTAALADPELLLAGTLMTHRRGPEKLRPYLQVSTWCPFCRHHHYFPFVDVFRLDAVIGPVTMPCRGSPYAGRDVYIGLDPEKGAENKRIYEAFRSSLRRHETQRRLERQLQVSRAQERAYLREFPDAAFSSPPSITWPPDGRPRPVRSPSRTNRFSPCEAG
jgi:hypothetical protein